MNRSSVPRLEGGGAGRGACGQIIEDTHVKIGMLIVEYIWMFVMVRMMGKEVLHWVKEWVMERIVALKECSKKVKRI